MTPEDAYAILEAIAEINGQTDKLKLITMSEEEQRAEKTAEEVEAEHYERLAAFTFSKCEIKPGDYISWYDNPDLTFRVVDDKKVEYEGKTYSLS